MKSTHHAIAAIILSAVFVVVGFVAEVSTALGAAGVTVSYLGYLLTLVAFLVVLWLLMLILMRNDPERHGARRTRR